MIVEFLLGFTRLLIAMVVIVIGIKNLKAASKKETHRTTYYLFGSGFILLGIGVTIEGILYEIFTMNIFVVHLIASIIKSVSLGMILYSLYTSEV